MYVDQHNHFLQLQKCHANIKQTKLTSLYNIDIERFYHHFSITLNQKFFKWINGFIRTQLHVSEIITVHTIQAMVNKFLYSITNCNNGKFCKEEIFLIQTLSLYISFIFCIIFAWWSVILKYVANCKSRSVFIIT